METDNIVVFWEAGFGADPSTADETYRVNMQELLNVAEKSYAMNVETLQFAKKGESVTDKYKLMIFLLYSTEWAAYGSGQDDEVGTLHVNPAAARINTVLAHEIGHCFQYITGCDTDGGFRYGFGANGAGGNGFWEQTAQWQAFKTYPDRQFQVYDYTNYLDSYHKHIFHEEPRYDNFFIHDYWAYKHGKDIVGRIWQESRRPEDPAEAYMRITNISLEQFNAEMWECAARLTTWDIPDIKAYGAAHINDRSQPAMDEISDNVWRISADVCPENFGYNSIKLNVPDQLTPVTVAFEGAVGESGFRNNFSDQGGWRFGFVALLNDGTRVYSDMGLANMNGTNNPSSTLTFNCPANCNNLWLVVSGAPQSYWRHAWDDDDSNDEQWPYQVNFINTNILGEENVFGSTHTLTVNTTGQGTVSPASGEYIEGSIQTLTAIPNTGFVFAGWSGDVSGNNNPIAVTMDGDKSVTASFEPMPSKALTYNISMEPMDSYDPYLISLDTDLISQTLGMTADEIADAIGTSVTLYGIEPDGTYNPKSTAIAPGQWFGVDGSVVDYGIDGYLYAELKTNPWTLNVGQFPDKSSIGDSYTIKQALVSDKGQLIITVNLTIHQGDYAQTVELNKGWNLISINVHPEDSSIASLFNGLDVETIKTFDRFWSKGFPVFVNSLETITAGVGYLVYMNNAGNLTVTGYPVAEKSNELFLQDGWNLIAVPYQTQTPCSEKFDSVNCQVIKDFYGLWIPGNAINTIENIEPGKAYFLKK